MSDPMRNMLLRLMFGQWMRYIKEDRLDKLERELAQAIKTLEKVDDGRGCPECGSPSPDEFHRADCSIGGRNSGS